MPRPAACAPPRRRRAGGAARGGWRRLRKRSARWCRRPLGAPGGILVEERDDRLAERRPLDRAEPASVSRRRRACGVVHGTHAVSTGQRTTRCGRSPLVPGLQAPAARLTVAWLTVAWLPVGWLPVGWLPVARPPVGWLPVARLPVARLPVGWLPVGWLPVARPPVAWLPVGWLPVASRSGAPPPGPSLSPPPAPPGNDWLKADTILAQTRHSSRSTVPVPVPRGGGGFGTVVNRGPSIRRPTRAGRSSATPFAPA